MRNTATEGEEECSTVVKIVNENKKSKQCTVLATGILRYTGCILQGRTVNPVFSKRRQLHFVLLYFLLDL